MSESKTEAAKEEIVKIAKPIINIVTTITPIIIAYSQKAWSFYKSLPEDYIKLIIGFILCFFGGIYPTVFAAVEAAKHGGIKTLVAALGDLSDEAIKIIEASKKDDDADADKDGAKDVDQIDAKALILRKANLVVTKMNPEKIDKAIASIYKVWLSVVAVLSLQFARTIALSMSISDFLKKPTDHIISPYVRKIVPREYEKWIPVVLGWITKSIAMSIAWYIQTVISAVTSAMIGALIISRALLKLAHKHELTFGGMIPKDHKETYIDEFVSYAFAFFGVWFQFKMNFDLPFPLNFLFWPLEMAEVFIRWSITKLD
mmetsp:Transcript_16358/g.19991  ORF Transcript_16358/g.19991 Transcript_16358/m.19991 type:complete len:316 (+) Transcript_16358:101-1048(+)